MSKKAEDAAIKAYPFIPIPQYDLRDENPTDGNKIHRRIFLEGYEQAEKDMITRASIWITNNCYIPHATLEDFRKAMEEE